MSGDLVEKYRAALGPADRPPAMTPQGFTVDTVPVPVSEYEEWPAAMSGAFFFLRSPVYEELLGALREARSPPARAAHAIARIVVQSELWAAFDELYLEGISPDSAERFDPARWRLMLWELARSIRHVAPTAEEVQALSLSPAVLPALFGVDDYGRSADFYNIGRPFFHDKANGLRRITRVRFYDPTLDFTNPTAAQLDDLLGRRARFRAGGKAMLEEYAFAVTTNLDLVPTPIPLVVKLYRVGGSEKDLRTEFEIYKIDRTARELNAAALRRFPDDAEGWAMIDLPNIPNGVRPAFRAPLRANVCAGCHAAFPNAFKPGYEPVPTGSIRLSAQSQPFAAVRTAHTKQTSPEAHALWHYFTSPRPKELATAADAVGPAPARPAEPEPTATGWPYGYAVYAACAAGLVVAAAGYRARHRARAGRRVSSQTAGGQKPTTDFEPGSAPATG